MTRTLLVFAVVLPLLACRSDQAKLLDPADRAAVLRHFDLAPPTVLAAKLAVGELSARTCWMAARVEIPDTTPDAWLEPIRENWLTTQGQPMTDLDWAPWFKPPPLASGRNFGEGQEMGPRVYRRALVENASANGRRVVWLERMTASPCP